MTNKKSERKVKTNKNQDKLRTMKTVYNKECHIPKLLTNFYKKLKKIIQRKGESKINSKNIHRT